MVLFFAVKIWIILKACAVVHNEYLGLPVSSTLRIAGPFDSEMAKFKKKKARYICNLFS